MNFTLFGLTFTIVRATPVDRNVPWYPGAERFETQRLIEASRVKGEILRELH